MAEKKCNACGSIKPFSEFCRKADKKDGLATQCKACAAIKNNAYYVSHKQAVRDKSRLWKLKQYGLTQESYEAIYESQGGKCPICTSPLKRLLERRNGHSAVDHCHLTGKVRALLCMACNSGLGYFRDNPNLGSYHPSIPARGG